MTARKRPVKIEPRQDHIIKKQYIPDWLKFWKRTPKPNLDKKHECGWLEEVNRLMDARDRLINDRDTYKNAFDQLNEQWQGHVCNPSSFASVLEHPTSKGFTFHTLEITWEDNSYFVDWLREVLSVKKWKNRAEQEYFLKFEFTEVLE